MNFLRLKGIQVLAFFKSLSPFGVMWLASGLVYLLVSLIYIFGGFDTLQYLNGKAGPNANLQAPYVLVISLVCFLALFAEIENQRRRREAVNAVIHLVEIYHTSLGEVEGLLVSGRPHAALEAAKKARAEVFLKLLLRNLV